ncbi:hypothetical protein BGW80DRAFT_1468752 [Lactifluus volemus]|nr:hypothetical protein BGW80DRAFT_1468752 [Lactifluus volemus]
MIFCHVPYIEFEECRIPSWMAIGQVCRLWRTTASSCKQFWSYIPLLTSEYWVEISLARSYPYPISFRVDLSTTGTQPGWYRRAALSALREISRARQVYLYISTAIINLVFRGEALHLLNASPAPRLETLSIQAGNMSSDSISLSSEIFLRHVATTLHALDLAYCDLGPSSLLLRAPLVTLCLENSTAPRIQKHISIIAFFLKGILAPASVSLSITCTDYIVDIGEPPLDDLPLLRRIVLTLSPVLSTYLERALEEGHVCPLLEISRPTDASRKTLELLSPTSPTRLQLSFIWGDVSGSTDLFSEMLSAFPVAALKHVHTLRMRDEADRRPRAYLWTHFRNKARDEAVRGLLAIVTQHGLLPALRQMSFEGVSFNKFDLADALVQRQRMVTSEGAMIKLSLRDCLISQDTIAALRDFLGSDAVDLV